MSPKSRQQNIEITGMDFFFKASFSSKTNRKMYIGLVTYADDTSKFYPFDDSLSRVKESANKEETKQNEQMTKKHSKHWELISWELLEVFWPDWSAFKEQIKWRSRPFGNSLWQWPQLDTAVGIHACRLLLAVARRSLEGQHWDLILSKSCTHPSIHPSICLSVHLSIKRWCDVPCTVP